MEYFAGLDVSLRSCAICVVDAKGKVMLERELPCEVGDIADCLNSFGYLIERVGFEAGTLSQHLFYGLTSKGFDVVCMEARQVNAALSAMRTPATGPDAAQCAKPRASPRCPTRPNGQNSNPEPRSRWIKVGGNVTAHNRDRTKKPCRDTGRLPSIPWASRARRSMSFFRHLQTPSTGTSRRPPR